jgi:hypothetical protein
MSQATPSDKVSEPPAYPVLWWVGKKKGLINERWDGMSHTLVQCRTWFDARTHGLRTFNCEVYELIIIQGDREKVVGPDGYSYRPIVSKPPKVLKPKSRTKRRR